MENRPVMSREMVSVGADVTTSAGTPAATKTNELWYWVVGAGMVGLYFYATSNPADKRRPETAADYGG